MNKLLLIIPSFTFFALTSHAQAGKTKDISDTMSVSGTEYIPIEGRSETGVPKELQGVWILQSGIQPAKPTTDVFNEKKPQPGQELRRDTITTTTNVNGIAYTSSEVEIQRVAMPVKQITPAQKDNLHQPEKPSISFFGVNETFSGFTGCNKYTGRYKINGNKITLLKAAASTKMVCIGNYDEKAFLNTLSKVDSFRSHNNQLELMDGGNVVLVFSRK